MANLLVRGVDEAVVKALKQRAGESGQSAEAEHRAILTQALVRPRKRSFAQVLASMPNVGTDADFERVNDPANAPGEAPRVFD
jgi:antitoxin FitA